MTSAAGRLVNIRALLVIAMVASVSACQTGAQPLRDDFTYRPPDSADPVVREIYQLKAEMEGSHELQVHFNRTCPSYYSSYRITANNEQLLKFLKVLKEEIYKYPTEYFRKSRAYNVCIGEDLRNNGVSVAAIPGAEFNTITYSLKPPSKSMTPRYYGLEYLREVIHHELHHNTDYTIWGSYYSSWKKWSKLNVPGFRYRGSGMLAYKNPKKVHKKQLEKGFLNKYSQLGAEEDRAEIMEALLVYPQNKKIISACKRDEIIRKKVNLLVELNRQRIEKSAKWHLHKVAALCTATVTAKS